MVGGGAGTHAQNIASTALQARSTEKKERVKMHIIITYTPRIAVLHVAAHSLVSDAKLNS